MLFSRYKAKLTTIKDTILSSTLYNTFTYLVYAVRILLKTEIARIFDRMNYTKLTPLIVKKIEKGKVFAQLNTNCTIRLMCLPVCA